MENSVEERRSKKQTLEVYNKDYRVTYGMTDAKKDNRVIWFNIRTYVSSDVKQNDNLDYEIDKKFRKALSSVIANGEGFERKYITDVQFDSSDITSKRKYLEIETFIVSVQPIKMKDIYNTMLHKLNALVFELNIILSELSLHTSRGK